MKRITNQQRMYTEDDYPAQRGMGEWGGMPEYFSENLKPFSTLDIRFKTEFDVVEASHQNRMEAAKGATKAIEDAKKLYNKESKEAGLHVHFERQSDDKTFRDITNTAKDITCRILDMTREEFSKLIDQTVTENTHYVWFPDVENMSTAHLRYVEDRDDTQWNPKYPVYIISKGRWESRLTSKAFERMNIPYKIVIEPQEFEQYEKVISFDKICVLPFSNLGRGSIPARNWCWQDAIDNGAERHWIIDDNIRGFYRLNHNKKIECTTGAIFRAAEDFVDRFENVGIAGFNYYMFAKHRDELPPYLPNRRIYSCILIKNDIDLRTTAYSRVPECTDPWWRGRYNEDTDLSIRAMKLKYCTVLFYSFLCYKEATMTMKGGNMDELYQGDGRLRMAESLEAQHPDITTIYHKFGRAQHLVDYSTFTKNAFKKKQHFIDNPPVGINDYNMVLKELSE